jgi:TatD DNase family protein
MLVDAHAHLDKYDDKQVEEVLAEVDSRRIFTMSVSVDPDSFIRAEAIAARSTLVVPSFGIQPEHAPSFVDSLIEIEELVNRSPMVGEIGLDHRLVTDSAQYGPQRRIFAFILDMANAQGKLVNVHSVGAEQDTFDMLRSHGIQRAILHWYSGPIDVLTKMIGAGYYFTVGVELLRSEHIRKVASLIPSDRLLTETDNPGGQAWLTGEIGQPSLLIDVLEALAQVRAVATDELIHTIEDNLTEILANDEHLAARRSAFEDQ